MTEVTADGLLVAQARATQWSGYPLPPPPPRFQPTWNRYKQYQLPHPDTGRPTAFTRATTVAKILDDTYNLDLWVQRRLIRSVLDGVRIQMGHLSEENTTEHRARIDTAMRELWDADPDTQTFNAVADTVNNLQGGQDAAEFGTAVHAWLEALDLGTIRPCEVPDIFAVHADAYRTLLLRHALLPEPAYVERIVLCDDNDFVVPTGSTIDGIPESRVLSSGETVVGTLDRLFRVITTGELHLGDVKTSKADSLSYKVLEFCIQLAVYRYARRMLSLDGSGWEPMPVLSGQTAYLMHIPSDDPLRSACITVNTAFGAEAMRIAIYVRDLRRRAKREGLTGTIPMPSPQALQWAAARHAIQDISAPADLAVIWEQYSEVWTEELTALGLQIADLITREGVRA